MRIIKNTVFLLAIASLAACASRGNMVVLLPDARGQAGKIIVETTAGTYTVDNAYQALCEVPDKTGNIPTLLFVKPEEVQRRFKAALVAVPEQRFRFEKQVFYYPKDSAEMVAESRQELELLLERWAWEDPVEIYLAGHTDSVGSEEYNLKLSRQRADSLRERLAITGIDQDRIKVFFWGKKNPPVETSDGVEEHRNRCVVMVTRYKNI